MKTSANEIRACFIDEKYGCGNETRIVLLGKTESGKGAIGNKILGIEQFEATLSKNIIAKRCKRAERMRYGNNLVVINSPDFFIAETSVTEYQNELVKWQCISSPGPHAILFVVSINKKQAQEVKEAMAVFRQQFGEEITQYIIVVLAGCHDQQEGDSVQNTADAIQTFSDRYDNRTITFENITDANDEKVSELFEMIDIMKKNNKSPYFSNKMLQDTEVIIRKQMVEILKKQNGTQTQETLTHIRQQVRNDIEREENKVYYSLIGTIGAAAKVLVSAVKEYCSPVPTLTEDDMYGCGKETRIVMLGKTGSGKSETGNTILGYKQFCSAYSPNSVTTKSQKGSIMRNNNLVVLIDTPGIFDTKLSKQEIQTEIIKWEGISSPGPHAILCILDFTKRQTPEEISSVQTILELLGENIYKYLVLVFTRFDELQRTGGSFDQYIDELREDVFYRTLLDKCENRIIPFNNIDRSEDKQVTDLFEMIEKIATENDIPYLMNMRLTKIEKKVRKVMRERIEREYGGILSNGARKQIRWEIRDDIEKERPIVEYWKRGAIGVSALAASAAIIAAIPLTLSGLTAAGTVAVATGATVYGATRKCQQM